MAKVFDCQKGKMLPGTVQSVTGEKVFISWRRLQTVLREAGEIRPNERLTHLEIGEWGISIVLERLRQR